MSAAELHRRLAQGPPLFAPFLVLGDPTPELSVELALRALDAGAGALELGIPHSDPVADGPEVCKAVGRALAAGTTTDVAFECLRRIRAHTEAPLNLLVYANLVHARGWRRFARDSVLAGASSLLSPDVSLEECGPLADACTAADLALVQLAGPATGAARLRELGRATSGFVYLVGHQGVTGTRKDLSPGLSGMVERAARHSERPVCLGFGLSKPAHLTAAFEAGARMAVVGSALLAHVRTFAAGPHSILLDQVEDACRQLASTTTSVSTSSPPCS